MNEANANIEITATLNVTINGVPVPNASIVVKKAIVVVDELQIIMPTASVS